MKAACSIAASAVAALSSAVASAAPGFGEIDGIRHAQRHAHAPSTAPLPTTPGRFGIDRRASAFGEGGSNRGHALTLTLAGRATRVGPHASGTDHTRERHDPRTPAIDAQLAQAFALNGEVTGNPGRRPADARRSFGYAQDPDARFGYDLGAVEPAPPAPELQTYALMLAGLGVVGLVARRRRRID